MKKIICLVFFVFFVLNVFAENKIDPLPSWKAGTIKNDIIQFVAVVTDKNNPHYVPPEDRVATFDNDGTLWVEQPIYPQVVFMRERMHKLAANNPEWKRTEPYKSVLRGTKNLTSDDFDVLIAATSADISVEDYQSVVKAWFSEAVHPRYKKHYNQLIYQPMLEVMDYLRANQFKVYIVSGGGQDYIRAFAYDAYGISPEYVIGATGDTSYVYREEQPELIKQSKLLFNCNYKGKPAAIHLFIGKKPIITFGNSDGDKQMLEWTQSGKGKHLMLLVHHDDAEREYAYDYNSKVGTFSKALMREVKTNHWKVISMKNDWKILFPFEQKPSDIT